MPIGKWFRDKFSLNSIPLSIHFGNRFSPDLKMDYSYAAMNKLLEDDRIYSMTTLAASMSYVAYRGIEMLPKSQFGDNKLSKEEIKALDAAVSIARKLDFKGLFYAYAFNTLAYGDYMERIIFNTEKGVTSLQSLPLNSMTIINDKGDINRRDVVITSRNLYLRDEEHVVDQFPYLPEDIVHVSYNSRGQWIRDILNRDTYGLYSIPPIATLFRIIAYKNETMDNDRKWRKNALSREHWTLDVDELGPNGFEGTKQEKINQSITAVNQALTSFKNVIDTPETDQSIITTKSATSQVLESKSGNYNSPNEILEQLNSNIGTPIGVSEAFLGGKVPNGTGLNAVSTFGAMRIDVLCNIIATQLVKVIKKHLSLTLTGVDPEIIDRLAIRINSALSQVELQTSKVVLNLVQTGLFNMAELRGFMGYSASVQEPYTIPVDQRSSRNSPEQVSSDISDESDGNEDTNTTDGANTNNNLGNSKA